MIDIDYFTQFNDRYGRLAGDAVLLELATVLRQPLRSDEEVGRFKDDQFWVFVSDDIGKAAKSCEGLRERVEAHVFSVGGEPMRLTVSIGVAQKDERAKNPSPLAHELIHGN